MTRNSSGSVFAGILAVGALAFVVHLAIALLVVFGAVLLVALVIDAYRLATGQLTLRPAPRRLSR